jgi:2-phospho-L-lactate guanylyltransferase
MVCRPWLIIPVKSLSLVKSSMQGYLSPDERRRLVIAMLSDVLAAAKKSKTIEKICVLSPDPEVLALAEDAGATPVREPGLDLNPAIEFAIGLAKGSGADSVLIIPADIPLISGEDIDGVVSMAGEDRVMVISPSKDNGTNALLLRPPDLIPPRFGGESFPAHLREATRAGAHIRIYRSENLAHDIDRPADLLRVKVLAPASKTSEFLSSLEGQDVLKDKVNPKG